VNATGGDPRSVIDQNRRAYQRIASEWSARHGRDDDAGFHERCRAIFLQHLRGERILDVGCGLGVDTQAFAAAGLRVIAADLVLEFLETIRRETPSVPVTAMDMTAPCFRAETFDGIYACASLLHIPSALVRTTLTGFGSLLRPGGGLFLHHVESTQGRAGYRVDDLLIDGNPAMCYCHAPQELIDLLALAGLYALGVSRLQPRECPSRCAEREGLRPYQVVARRTE
jgi:SAM-dependent methyltransferase